MGRDLTKKYSIDKLNVGNLFSFVGDVYSSGKLREIISFAIWETFHKLHLFPMQRYIKFNGSVPAILKSSMLIDETFENALAQLFKSHHLGIAHSAQAWKRMFINREGKIFGYLEADDCSLYVSEDHGKSVRCVSTLPEKIKSIFVSSQNTILVSVKGAVYRGTDNGQPFEKVIDLGSPESFFRHNYAVTEAPDKTLIIGEYGNLWENNTWRRLANLYFSSDNGKTWEKTDFLIKKGINKHVHIIYYSRLLKKLFLADGDNKKKLWIGETTGSFTPENIKWVPITKFHIQTGGYTSVVEADGKILFGTDYQGGTNFIVETRDGRKYIKRIVPDPYRRSPIHSLVLRKSKRGNEIWANLPIAMSSSWRNLLMYTLDGGETWNKVLEYNAKNHSVSLISAASDSTDELYCAIEDIKNGDRVVYKITDLVEA